MPERITRAKWDKTWRRSMAILAKSHPDRPLQWRTEEARRRTKRATGTERPPGMPLWLELASKAVGEGGNVKKLWNVLDGKKTFLGVILVSIPVIWEGVAQILGAGGMGPEQVAAIGGIVLGAVGIAHKVLKFFSPNPDKPPVS